MLPRNEQYYFLECSLLYLCASPMRASLMVKMPGKARRGSMQEGDKGLFLSRHREIRSSSAFECGITSNNRPILDRRGDKPVSLARLSQRD